MPSEKLMLRQIEWEVQSGPITKEQSFVTDYFDFLKF